MFEKLKNYPSIQIFNGIRIEKINFKGNCSLDFNLNILDGSLELGEGEVKKYDFIFCADGAFSKSRE